jgi:hypothetical protein
MTLSPRQIAAYLEFSNGLDRIERANNLLITSIATQGDSDDIRKALKELNGFQTHG